MKLVDVYADAELYKHSHPCVVAFQSVFQAFIEF